MIDPRAAPSFGEVELDLGEADFGDLDQVEPAAPPPSSVHDASTRILEGDALSAVTRPPPPPSPADDEAITNVYSPARADPPVAALRELYLSGDEEGALALAARLVETLAPPPEGPHVVPGLACPLTLTERHSVPRLLRSMSELSHLKIDHRAGFLLAHVDGMHTLEDILDVCAMPAAEALSLISSLREMGVIELE
jgi:hypothetical protein